MKFAIILAILLPAISHAQIGAPVKGSFREIKFADGHTEIRRIDDTLSGRYGDPKIILDGGQQVAIEQLSDTYSTFDVDRFVVRNFAGSRAGGEKRIISRVTRLIMRGDRLAALEVAGENGLEVIQHSSLNLNRDDIVVPGAVGDAIHSAGDGVHVEIPQKTWELMAQEGSPTAKDPYMREALKDMVAEMNRRPNAATSRFATIQVKQLLGGALAQDYEIKRMLSTKDVAHGAAVRDWDGRPIRMDLELRAAR
jgi:hypothetical protein